MKIFKRVFETPSLSRDHDTFLIRIVDTEADYKQTAFYLSDN